MICPSCTNAADLADRPAPQLEAVRALATKLHGACRGGSWCECQHRVAPIEVLAARRAAMPAGGLARIADAFAEAAA